jgi:glycosyltransferase involved in cell wall biosynthesis
VNPQLHNTLTPGKPVLKKIKILQGIRQGKIGGGESYLLSLVENLDRSRFEPVVLSFTDGPMVERLQDLGIKTHIIPTETPFDVRVWKRVKNLVVEEGIDLVHAHGTRAASNVFWAAKKAKLPLIYTCHAWSFHRDQNSVVKKLRILGEQFLTTKADVNICGSKANRETGRQLFKNFDAVIINNSIDPKRFNPYGVFKNIRAELGIKPDEILVTSIARFTLQKQPLKLIAAFAEVSRKISNVRLLMVGDGEQKEQAIKLIQKLNLQDKIILQPFRQDVPDVLAAADIFVLPSLWEAFPIALLEAMSMGKAVIATNVDGTPEIIEAEKNGLLIEVEGLQKNIADALIRLCSDAELRRRLQQAALKSIYNTYNVETLARKNEAIYQRLVPEK